jgi:hypothetical protein
VAEEGAADVAEVVEDLAEEVEDLAEEVEDLAEEDAEEDLVVSGAEEDLDTGIADTDVVGEDAVGEVVEDIMETTTITMALVALVAHHILILYIFVMKMMIAIFAAIVVMAYFTNYNT